MAGAVVLTITLNAALDLTYALDHVAARGQPGADRLRARRRQGHQRRARPGGPRRPHRRLRLRRQRRRRPDPRRPRPRRPARRAGADRGQSRRTVAVVSGGAHHVQRGRADGHGDRMGPAGRPRPPAGRRGQLRRALRQPAAGRAHRRLRRPRPDRRRRRRARGDRHRRRRAARGPPGRPAWSSPTPPSWRRSPAGHRGPQGGPRRLRGPARPRRRLGGGLARYRGPGRRTAEGSWQAPPPERVAGNPAGSGDAAVAALTLGLVRGWHWQTTLAAPSPSPPRRCTPPVAGGFDPEAYRHLGHAQAEPL